MNDVLNADSTESSIQLLSNTTPLAVPRQLPQPPIATTMCENSQSQSSIDDLGSNDDVIGNDAYPTIDQGADAQIQLSKKAINQRDADENLFLRFLELDPPDTPVPSAPQTPAIDRRKSTYKPATSTAPSAASSSSYASQGRTPFTITKKLTRTPDKGFGFSIVWTHPPRIEKCEPGLSADRCGIYPGDYVIFVDKHNVVTMPEMDILNLIRSQGNTLVLEIFRRTGAGTANKRNITTNSIKSRVPMNNPDDDSTPKKTAIVNAIVAATCPVPLTTPVKPTLPRLSTVHSNVTLSLESTKRRLHLPQVTFSQSTIPTSGEEATKKYLYQLISREQHFVTALQYGIQRFTAALQERKDLISAVDHRTLFQNIEEILRLSEDILEQLLSDDQEPQVNFAARVYLSKSTAFCAAYKKYCNGLKRADCVLVNKSRHSNSEFVTFINVPQVPRKRPDLTTFIHRPLQHFREVLKLILMLASHCRPESEECKNFTTVITALQASYREITVGEGLMEPLGEGRPLLTLQDLEARLVFTKCKPFVLSVPGRQWIFGGDLSRVEDRSVKPYWTLLFSDIILFAKVSRDRVLFITEEPIPLAHITDSNFNIRKKSNEFRVTVDPNGRLAESPTAHCTPDLTRTPRKNTRKRIIVLRTPTPELKAVWQNLLQRQIFLVNATLNSAVSSPLESPDILQSFIPLCDIGAATTSMASIKLSADSINNRSQQVRHIRLASFSNSTSNSHPNSASSAVSQDKNCVLHGGGSNSIGDITANSKSSSLRTIYESHGHVLTTNNYRANDEKTVRFGREYHHGYSLHKPLVEFSISSVGRSFIDETEENDNGSLTNASLKTPDTPTPNISPSSSNRFSETFSNDFLKTQSPNGIVSPISDETPSDGVLKAPRETFAGSWDLLELDLDFHDVNFDPSFGGDVEEREFMGDVDDPLGILPQNPTPPDTQKL